MANSSRYKKINKVFKMINQSKIRINNMTNVRNFLNIYIISIT